MQVPSEGGAIAVVVIGFNLGGWVIGAAADKTA
jgi:hypothetical protein